MGELMGIQQEVEEQHNAKAAYDEVFRSLEEHESWFGQSIPLIASENVPSPAVREAIISDFGNRYAEKGRK